MTLRFLKCKLKKERICRLEFCYVIVEYLSFYIDRMDVIQFIFAKTQISVENTMMEKRQEQLSSVALVHVT